MREVSDLIARLQTALSDRYDIEAELGGGGMGAVYLARDVTNGRHVVIKMLNPEFASDESSERFLKEVRLTLDLQHPRILPVLDTGEVDGIPFYITPHIEGGSLRDRLVRQAQLPLDEALGIVRDVADALSYAHSRRVIHRDIKPGNILLGSDGAVVSDLGLARALDVAETDRITRGGVVLGTAEYMSPEQALNAPAIDGRCDLYALGCVLYEMLAGEPPFTGVNSQAIFAKHLKQRPTPLRVIRPDIPDWVERALDRALAKEPSDRYQSAGEFSESLRMRSAVGGWLIVAVVVAVLAMTVLMIAR